MSDKRSRHDSDAKSQQGHRSSYHTRSEASFSTASSGLSEARRRAALSKLQADQTQRAAAAKAELARRLAEAEAALEAQAAKDEAERCQLELELLEQEERGSQPRSSAPPSVAGLPVVATEPPARVCVSQQMDESVTRTRQWLAQSQPHVPPAYTAPVGTLPPPAVRLQHPSRDDNRAVPHLPRITLEKFGGSAIEWPRWIALFKALVHDRADLTDVERLTYLQTHLTGPAKESVRGMLCDASLYSTALGELEREFGDPSRVIHATMKRLLTARPVKDGDLSALTELSRELHTAAVERRLDRDPDLCRSYRDTMNDYITQGHASKVSGEQRTHGRTWYLPHHAVQNPNKPGKVRVVFDAAARCGGTSLNDNLITGPNNLNSLAGVLMRFRQGRVPIASDVKQMFHQITIRADDRHAQQFLWRDMDTTKEPETYQMNVVIFGAKSSPSTATYVLRRCAEDGRDKHARAADKVISRFYMDDYLDSVDTESEGRELVNSLNSLLSAGGFHLTKWTSTSDVVLKDVPPEDKCEESRDLDLTGENKWMKTLGVHWCAQDDQFRFKVKKVDSGNTKRSILSITSAVFDPLGMLAPFIVRAKCLIQKIWLGGWDWDEAISDSELLAQWHSWQRELNDTDCVRVGRCYRPDDRAIVNCQLHVFGDASELAFGVVAYLRFELEDGTGYCSFVMSKVRVAPIKQLSIPRLELQAAVMAVRVADTIKAEHDMAINETVFWSDSSTVLQWINSESRRFNTFVANRIAEIQDASDVTQWRHVPGPLNPADICSRGCSVTELAPGGVWVQGPAFLRRRHQDWPAAPPRTTERPRDEETAEMRVIACATGGAEPAINPSRFSSWLRLLRVTAWVCRFAHNSRSRAAADRRTGPLTAEELREAERVWLLSTQAEQFGDEVAALQHGRRLPSNSRLHQLTPFLDSTGLLRVGGRLRHAQMDFEVKHQVILPARGDITRLIVTDRHKKLAHSGAEHVLTHLRQQFWVICGRAAVKRYTRACMLCRKRSARPAPPLMGDLPAFRVGEPAPVFARVGVDFFGPLTVKKHRKREKRYGCLFTCLSTRAVHIELAHSLDTDSFIMAMRRMMARRGNVSLVCSDNGTNFRAGEREMRQALQQWNQTKIADTLSQEGVEWRFNPPGAPHFGGVFERLVRSAKRALTTVLGDRAVDDETLRTVVTEVEGLLNGRPLTYISTDPDDYQPLTPNHFLIGRASPQLPPGVFVDGDLCGRRRWKHTQVLIDHIWRRWRREYLPTLTTRVKWRADTADVQLGELVLVTDDNLPRGHWPVGRVVNVFPGADGRCYAFTLS
ncbi:uncharacterized protein LOC122394053 [Amphibalanus amphitrite]|uniref:uncharacterized protein LOC122394053 n=1 Tax=Amphibalanus amphitrite TaxID=1232801 RepID=UPI001C90FB94|nr:uncharacterized protein LOC122394053 [Amphibalanus amphitrite]